MPSDFERAVENAAEHILRNVRPSATAEDGVTLDKALLKAVRIRSGRDYGDYIRREDGVAVQAAVLARARDLFRERFDRLGRLPQEVRDAVIAELLSAMDDGFDAFMRQFMEGGA